MSTPELAVPRGAASERTIAKTPPRQPLLPEWGFRDAIDGLGLTSGLQTSFDKIGSVSLCAR
jgi:hypothetical protein